MANKEEERHRGLDARLRKIEARFEHEMRERGFDPAQADNVALPGPLAKLYAEREELRAELHIDQQSD
jgi:hypothetical protein